MTYLVDIIRCVLIILVLRYSREPRSKIGFLSFFRLCCITNFNIAWLIYGNTFHYSQAALDCRDSSQGTFGLWVLEMILIAAGYLSFIFHAFGVALVSYALYKRCTNIEISEKTQRIINRVPYANLTESFSKKPPPAPPASASASAPST